MQHEQEAVDAVARGRELARAWPSAGAAGPSDLAVVGAATLALKRLGEEARRFLEKAAEDDAEAALAALAQLFARARAVEPVAAGLRSRWGEPSAHARAFQWPREVAFTVLAAAAPKAPRASARAHAGSLAVLDPEAVRARWTAVRAALAAMEPVNPEDWHDGLESELAALRGAAVPQRVAPRERIPREHQSRAMGKGEAARLHAGVAVPDADAYFERLVVQGIVTAPIGSGRQWRFDVREFPASKRELMR